MKNVSIFLLLCFFCSSQFIFSACKNPASEKTISGNAENSSDVSLDKKTFTDAIKALPAGGLLDSNSIKGVLPESLLSFPRISILSRQTDYAGYPVTITNAIYKKENQTIYVAVTDVGSNTGYVKYLAAWSEMQFENKTADSYEKSYTRWGNKTNEKYNSTTKSAAISVIYDDRLLVTLEGQNLTVEDLHKAIQ